MWSLKSKINNQAEEETDHRHKAQTDGCKWKGAWGVGGGGGMEKHRLVVTEHSRDVNYSAGNTVSNIVVTVCGARRVITS